MIGKSWWERQKAFGRWLDDLVRPNRKSSHLCLFPGCLEFVEWMYLSDGGERPVVQPLVLPFLHGTTFKHLVEFLRHPIAELRTQFENDRIRYGYILGACDAHRKSNCVWTRRWLEAHERKAGKGAQARVQGNDWPQSESDPL